MKQLELLPYLIDRQVIDDYHLILDSLKLYKKLKYTEYRSLHQYEYMKRGLIKDRNDNVTEDLTFRRLLKLIEKNVNRIKEDQYSKDVDIEISSLNHYKRIIERKICDAARF